MKKIILFYFIVFSQSVFSQVIFPSSEKKCVSIRNPCSYDANATCVSTYCGNEINKLTLESFVNNHYILGKKFNSILEIEDYFNKNLPKELKVLNLRIVGDLSYNTLEYNDKRITIVVNKFNSIISVKIG